MIKKENTYNLSLSKVWSLWTTHEGLKSFFGLDNKVEIRPGGSFEIYFFMDLEYGLRGSEGCKVLSYVPRKMLSFSWNAPPSFSSIRNQSHKTIVSVFFNELDESNTKIELYHHDFLDSEEWNKLKEYFENAWETVFERLKFK